MIVRDFPRIVTLHFLCNNSGEIPYYHIGLFADFESYCNDIMEVSFYFRVTPVIKQVFRIIIHKLSVKKNSELLQII